MHQQKKLGSEPKSLVLLSVSVYEGAVSIMQVVQTKTTYPGRKGEEAVRLITQVILASQGWNKFQSGRLHLRELAAAYRFHIKQLVTIAPDSMSEGCTSSHADLIQNDLYKAEPPV